MTPSSEPTGTILVVDDEQTLARFLSRMLQGRGFHVGMAYDAREARLRMGELYPDVVLMDLDLPDADGAELMVELREAYPESQFIIITAHGSIRSAVETTRLGAVDYLPKPVEPDELFHAIRIALRERALGEEVRRLRDRQVSRTLPLPTVGTGVTVRRKPSAAMLATLGLGKRAAEQEGIVLLLGESGTGKDYLARWIHRRSRRSAGPFFDINCAALSRELAESELFGHEPGAFTGTRGRKRGLLELAEDGTLLLNEVGELDLALQSKLLTFLDTRSFLRVGGERSISVNARIFAATNRDLEEEVRAGRFRSDLYYRLNVFPIRIPSLRERREDLPALVEELLERLASELALGERPQLTAEALAALERYDFPGNIRELRNLLERAIILTGGGTIERAHLDLQRGASAEWQLQLSFVPGQNLHDVTRQVARELVTEALRRFSTRKEAAEALGISRHALAHQLKALGLE